MSRMGDTDMASATKGIRKVKKVVEVDEECITLFLSPAEAAALKAVTGVICGCPNNSPRKLTSNVYAALDLLVPHTAYRKAVNLLDCSLGGVKFLEGEL